MENIFIVVIAMGFLSIGMYHVYIYLISEGVGLLVGATDHYGRYDIYVQATLESVISKSCILHCNTHWPIFRFFNFAAMLE